MLFTLMAADHQSSNSDLTNIDNQHLIPIFPNDVALLCLARIPPFHHPSLSLVCKSWRSILLSPHFHATRRALSSTQPFLSLNLRIFNPKDSTFSFQWYTLDPSRTFSTNPQTGHYPQTLTPIKPCPSQPIGASLVFLGHKLYVIGGSFNDIPSNNVWVFDFVSNNWELGPKMRVGREFAASGVIDGKIYVLGGCVVDNWARSMNWVEVFDPNSSLWVAVPSPVELREKWMHASAVIGGKLYAMADRGGVIFDPRLGEWEPVSTELDMGWRGRAAVVDGVLYCYDYLGRIRGFDVEENVWKGLKGLENGLPKFLCGATMANVGGMLIVAWEEKHRGSCNGVGNQNGKDLEVFCAEIKVKKHDSGDLWGSIVWLDMITTIPKGSSIVHCLGVHI